MAVGQIFDPNMRGTGWKFGESVGQGIEGLLGQKMKQMERERQEQNNYEALIAGGMEPEKAMGFSKASPKILEHAFQDIFSRWSALGIPKKEADMQVVSNEPSAPSYQSQNQPENPQTDFLQQLMGAAQQKTGNINPQQALMQALQGGNFNTQQGLGALNPEEGLLDYLKSQQIQSQSQPFQQEKPMQQQMPMQKGQQPGIQTRAPGIPPTRQEARALESQLIQERRHQENIAQRREESEKKDIRDAYAFSKKFGEQTQKDASIARKTNNAYKTIYDLAKSGNTRSGGWFKTLDSLGLNEYYRNPATQLAQKEIASLAQGAAAAFNTPRLNAMEVQLYEDSLIKMSNTPEAMMTIAKNKILEGDAMILRDNVRRQIIAENNNKPPYDLSDQVYDRIEPKLAELAQIAQDNSRLTGSDPSLADASAFTPDTIIRVDGIEYAPKGKYWVRV